MMKTNEIDMEQLEEFLQAFVPTDLCGDGIQIQVSGYTMGYNAVNFKGPGNLGEVTKLIRQHQGRNFIFQPATSYSHSYSYSIPNPLYPNSRGFFALDEEPPVPARIVKKIVEEHFGCLHTLFVNVKFHGASRDWIDTELRRIPFRPSCVLGTGVGLHVFWFLKDPIILKENEGEAWEESNLGPEWKLGEAWHALNHLAFKLRGRNFITRLTVPTAYLCLPFTTYREEYRTPHPVILESLDTSRRYAIEEFEPWLWPKYPTQEDWYWWNKWLYWEKIKRKRGY